jgi:hypothetical protein
MKRQMVKFNTCMFGGEFKFQGGNCHWILSDFLAEYSYFVQVTLWGGKV